MKRIIAFAFLLMFTASPCLAGSVQDKLKALCGAAGCSEATNEVGDRTQEATDGSASGDIALMVRGQADCSGSLGTGYIYSNTGLTTVQAKLCIYNSTSTTPVTASAADSLIACSASMESTSNGWKSAAFSSGTVVKDNYYWYVIVVSTTNTWTIKHAGTAGVTAYYKASSGWYAGGAPASFNGLSFSSAANYGHNSAYATIK